MQFLTALFGGADNTLLNAAFALGLVLVLVVLGLWVLKIATNAGANLGRPASRRLTVVDTAMVDNKRRVVIIRRDDVEHVIMTGGPADLVIETGVPVPGTEPRRATRPRTKRAAAPPPEPEVSAPPPPVQERTVSRDAVARLRDLVRPSPLRPVDPIRPADPNRYRGLMRPDIPTGPQLRVDNSAGPQDDSARSEPDEMDEPPTFVDGTALFKSIARRVS